MKINRNMSAVITNKQLLRTESKLSASMERLSSGYKINKPGDNPSGMAISNKMRAQIRALDQAEDNIDDGISVMQIADGALNETTSILQRMRELSVQAANGTNSDSDKEAIQSEIDQLKEEVDRISEDTEYNEKKLLNGTSDTRVYSSAKNISRVNISDEVAMGFYSLTVDKNASQATTTFDVGGANDLRTLQSAYESQIASENAAAKAADPTYVDKEPEDSYVYINDVAIKISSSMDDNEYLEALRSGAEKAGCEVEIDDTTGALNIYSRFYGTDAEITISYTEGLATQMGLDADTTWTKGEEDSLYTKTLIGEDAELTLGNGFTTTTTYSADGNRITISDQGGFSMEFLLDADSELATEFQIEVTDVGKMVLQTGGNEYQTIDVRIPEVSTESMYLDTVDVTVYNGAEDALTTLDDALAYLNEVRSRIGAYQNRLEYAESSSAATNENMTNAYSVLMDTDMAEEMSEYTQQNVLDQASISVLSQANQMPQQILSLLS